MYITSIPEGVLSDTQTMQMIDDGLILSKIMIAKSQIQPASLDLRLGYKAYRVRASFLPGSTASVLDRLSDLTMHKMNLSKGAVL